MSLRNTAFALTVFSLTLTAACSGNIAPEATGDAGGTAPPTSATAAQNTPPGVGTAVPGQSDGGFNDTATTCCPADPTPGCCMHFGGWASVPGVCTEACDGMPVPNDPSWKLVPNGGCPQWTYEPGGAMCGAPVLPDAGPDASPTENDPACPATFDANLCGQACDPFGLTCAYAGSPNGMSCISVGAGGDAGFVDGGGAASVNNWFCTTN